MINQSYSSVDKAKICSLALLFFALLCISCSKKEVSYFPLSEGYKWQYDVSLVTRDGLLSQKYILNNLGIGELEGVPVYLRQSLDGTILYYSISDEGIHYLGNINDRNLVSEFNEDKQLVIPEPHAVNTQWEQSTITKLLKKTGPPQKTVFEIFAKVDLLAKIESLDEIVSVPAGRFEKCMKITMSGSSFKDAGNYVGLTLVNVEQTSWYAPGVGLVKLERIETTRSAALDKGTLSIELAEFKSG
jgi:hypothetical protein